MPEIRFGTDGWRGLIADDFTFANVRRVAGAIASYVLKKEDSRKGLVVGYDTRFLSRQAAEVASEVLAAAGVAVRLASDCVPTPAVSFAVKHFGAAGGVVVTSSHNPWQWNGVKYKAGYGGSATPAIMQEIEKELHAGAMPQGKAAAVTETDFIPSYVAAITQFADLDQIARAGFKVAIDAMYGSGRGVLAGIFRARGIPHVEIRGELNPLFPGINPEPIEPHIQMLRETVARERCHAGFATDGDADRIGAVAEDGSFVDAHKIFCLLLRWLVERKQWPGEVARAFNTTGMVDRICARHGRKLHETGIGFKYLCEWMLTREMLVVGEESGGIGIPRHLPERDGILNSLLLAGIMAEEGRTLAQLVADLQQQYGPHHFGRRDLHMSEDEKVAAMRRIAAGLDRVGRYKVLRSAATDGVKFFLDAPVKDRGAEPWILMRASGTELLLRLYAEASSPELVEEILDAGEKFVREESPVASSQ